MTTEIHELNRFATLKPEKTHHWEYWFDDYIDAGVCYASVSILNPWGGELEVTQQKITAQIYLIKTASQFGKRCWKYAVSVKNKNKKDSAIYTLRIARIYE